MLTRRLLLRLAPSPTVRTLSTTAWYQRSPSLADIEPNGAPTFDARQKKFRDGIKEAQAAKEKQDSQSAAASSTPSTASTGRAGKGASAFPSSYNNEMSDGHMSKALGSLSTHNTEAARENSEKQDASKRKGALSSLIYGTREGQQMDQEIEKSFSQVLARGKYVHSIVFHSVKPDKVDEYVDLVGGWYPKMAKIEDNHVHLVGSWRTEVGDCDTFVHIWEYQRYQGYHASLHSIASHPDFPAFDRKLKTLITQKQTSLMQEFSFWPTTPPRQLGGLFELRSYTLHPGNLLEWETHWRKGLKARREVMEGVGAWFVQIGDLNTVHHLWQFANLEERKARREMSWGVEGWGDTVHKTGLGAYVMESGCLKTETKRFPRLRAEGFCVLETWETRRRTRHSYVLQQDLERPFQRGSLNQSDLGPRELEGRRHSRRKSFGVPAPWARSIAKSQF
ncbi:MAG: hypothetical protein Q9181_003097 [Wetmoreana brouardii]